MKLTKQQIDEFRVLYYQEFGELIEDDEATSITSNLLELYMLLLSPTPSERKARQDEITKAREKVTEDQI